MQEIIPHGFMLNKQSNAQTQQTQTGTHQTKTPVEIVEIVEIFSQEGADKFLQTPGAVKNLFISTKDGGLTHYGKPRRFEKRSARRAAIHYY